MSKSLKDNLGKRIVFPPGVQQQFLSKAMKNLNLSWSLFADKIGVHKRTLNDWKREECSMPLDVVKKISVIAKVKIPQKVEIRERFWYVDESAKIGWMACVKKHGRVGGDPEYRKKKWHEWWEQKGKFIKRERGELFKRKVIKKPRKSKYLAEFVGIVLGDGGITSRQVQISLHKHDDKEYASFIKALIKRLFNLKTGICRDKKSNGMKLYISSVELIDYLLKLGLKIGNKVKQQVDIPDWVKLNNQYAVACTRGLIDTDGSVFTHRYKVNGKWYKYKKLSFTSYSEPLRQSVFNILKENGLNPRLDQGRDVRLDSIKDMKTYFQLIGFNNKKHLKRYRN